MTLYRTIVADPPWPYEPLAFTQIAATGKSKDSKRYPSSVPGRTFKRSLPYQGMELDRIRKLPIRRLADPSGCRLFLWATNRHLHGAFHVLEEWGFRYVQTLVWHKPNPVPFSVDVAPSSAEFILTGLLGRPGRMQPWQTSVVVRGNQRVHSKKPELFLDLIEQASPGPYLELFARRQRLGWDTWGDQALEHVEVGA